MNKFVRNVKKYYLIILAVGILFILDWIPYESGYFKSDIETFQRSVKELNTTIALSFAILATVSIIICVLTRKFRLKSKSDRFDFIIRSSIFTIAMTLALMISIDGLITKSGLLINKQKSDNTIVRSYNLWRFDSELNKMVVFDSAFESVDMNQETYNHIKGDSLVQIRFEIGVLEIPFNPTATELIRNDN